MGGLLALGTAQHLGCRHSATPSARREPFVRARVKPLVKGPDDKALSAELISPEMCMVPVCNVRRQLCLKYLGDVISKTGYWRKGVGWELKDRYD